MNNTHYDLVVIGSGPAGQKGAIAAAKMGKRVAVIERKGMVGGASLHTGTIPSKTLREAIMYLSRFRQRLWYGKAYRLKDSIPVVELASRVQTIIEREIQVIRSQLKRNDITLISGIARFISPHELEIQAVEGESIITSDHFLIACGSRAARTPSIPFDEKIVSDSDSLFQVDEIPRQVIVVGGGVIGLEYASMLTALDSEVTIVDQRESVLDFIDREMVDALIYQMRQRGATFRLGEKVISVVVESPGRVVATLESGKRLTAQALLYAVGRETNADMLNLHTAGVTHDLRGRIKVNDRFQTEVPHISAAGDVIGFPSLASTSMEQGRLASCYMFDANVAAASWTLPFGIYTIPELSIVGKTEQELTEAHIPYEVGTARFEELAKSEMMGDETGLLKLIFDTKTLKLFGVHIMGDGAAELIHLGQAVMKLGGTIEYFRDSVFNYPTLAEAYKVAALDGLNKLQSA